MRWRVALSCLLSLFGVGAALAVPIQQVKPPPGADPSYYMYSSMGCDNGTAGGPGFIGSISYNADSRILSYQSDRCYSVAGSAEDAQAGALNPIYTVGRFVWEASLNSAGNVVGHGSASMYWDLGDGLQKVLEGDVVRAGSWSDFCDAGTDNCVWNPASLIRVRYEDPVILAMAGAAIGDYLEWRGYFQLSTPSLSLSQSFVCDFQVDCRPFSGDVYWGYEMSAPGTLPLLALSFVALLAMRRVPELASVSTVLRLILTSTRA